MDDNQEQWITSIMDDGGQSSGLFKKDISGREKMSSGTGGLNEAPLFIGEKKVVATIVYTNKQGLSIYNDIETKEQLEKATDYEHVYIISVELN
ncbi:hypothetical protein [Virgibacillus sp. DJP39]|uniref:hypothetical protein n=1 Tax=Virgibacillus sp. DJP39 TaxID=3409790 RepID=UPI003BB772DC